jgi:outer membrane protein TolC
LLGLAGIRPAASADRRTPAAAESSGSSGGSASTESQPSPLEVPAQLSLKQCLELALRHNADYKQSLVTVANAQSKEWATNQLNHMSINADVASGRNQGRDGYLATGFGPSMDITRTNGADVSSGATIPGPSSPSVDGQANLQYTLPLLRGHGSSSTTRAQLEQARIDAETAKFQQFNNEQNLIFAVTQDYYNVLRAQDLLKIQQQAVTIAQEQATASQKRLDAGLITELDVTRAQLQLSNTQAQLIQRQQAYQDSVDTLVLILGLPVGAQPALTDTVSYAYSPADEASAISAALRDRPELNLDRLSQESADVQLTLAHTQRKPQADLKFNLASIGFGLLSGTGVSHLLTTLLGLHVNVPMKDRTLQSNFDQAERNRDVLDDMYEFERQKIVSEVRGLVRQAEASKANVDLQTTSVEVARKSVHIAQRMVDEGLRDNFYLLDAQSSQTSAESSLLSAKVDYLLTMINLRKAMGLSLREHFGLPDAADDGYYPRSGRQLLLTRRQSINQQEPRRLVSEAGPAGAASRAEAGPQR